MPKSDDLVYLIIRAQGGDKESLTRLSTMASDRLLPYIHRLTLNLDVAQDILQETLLHIVKSIKELQQPERFWNWIFKIAKGKVQHYYRDRSREKEIQMEAFKDGWRRCEDSSLMGYKYVLRKELSEIVIQSVAKLSLHHRTVVALRFYENMPYSQIAEVMDCKEIYARVLFLRAKKLLRRDLVRRGYGKEHLLLSLALFGAITAKGEAASATTYMSASMLSVGALAVMLSALSSRAAMVTTSLITLFGVLVTSKSFYYGIGITLLALYILFWVSIANIYKS